MNQAEAKRWAHGNAAAMMDANLFEDSDLMNGVEDLPPADQQRVWKAMQEIIAYHRQRC